MLLDFESEIFALHGGGDAGTTRISTGAFFSDRHGSTHSAGHLLRKIDNVLNLEFLRDLASGFYSTDQGRPSIDPVVFARMILLQALYNINSDRQLCEEVGFNLAYRWFCRLSLRDAVPDHSSITRIRDRLGEETYEKIFLKILDQCREAGLIKGERVFVDGSFISANASIYTMKPRENQNDIAPPKPGTGIGAPQSKDGLSNNDLKKHSIAGKKLTNATHYSPSDPEATLSGKHMEYKSLRYKTHDIVDADSRVILDCHVTTGAVSDHTPFPKRIVEVQKALGNSIQEVIADRGYGSGENLKFLHENGFKTNIPLWSSRAGTALKDFGFTHEAVTDTMICPEGKTSRGVQWAPEQKVYTFERKTCSVCPRFMSCVREPDRRSGRGKRMRVNHHQEIFDAVLEQEKDPLFKKNLRERMWKMEGLFAEGKSFHGLRRARYRGRWKVQAQVYVISTIQNLKRLAALLPEGLKSLLSKLAKIAFGQKKFFKFSIRAA